MHVYPICYCFCGMKPLQNIILHFYELFLNFSISSHFILGYQLWGIRTSSCTRHCLTMAALYTADLQYLSPQRWSCLLFTQCPTCQGKKDKYSLTQTTINGWAQKCTGKQDVATYKQPASAMEKAAYMREIKSL